MPSKVMTVIIGVLNNLQNMLYCRKKETSSELKEYTF